MTYPRSMSVSLESTRYYHVVSRCVRRAWLWGFDEYAGKDYSHRKAWVIERLSELCSVFSIDCLVYSIAQRIRQLQEVGGLAAEESMSEDEAAAEVPLLGFRDEVAEPKAAISFGLREYLELVDWSARVIRDDQRAAMDPRLPPLLRRMNIDRDAWRNLMRPGGTVFSQALGKLDRLVLYAKARGRQHLRGQRQAECLYGV